MSEITLSTAFEVIKESPLHKEFSTVYIKPNIRHKERKTFRNCMGMDFYKLLLADLKHDASTIQEYNTGSTYASGSLVVWDGSIFRSTADGNTLPIWDDPNNTKWVIADKFNTECYNRLWCEGGLKRYLAYVIAATSIRYATYQASSKGVVVQNDITGVSTAGKAEFLDYKKELLDDAEDILYDMTEWIKEEHEAFLEDGTGCDFTVIDFIEADYCKGAGCATDRSKRNSRIMFLR